jgi:hypothetical protein
MWRSRRNPLVLSLALVLLLVVAVASSASVAGADEPVVVGELPAVPILKEPAAQGAAWTQVRKFKNHSPLVRIVSFKGCERGGLEKFTCTFSGRGSLRPGASACHLTVVVTGLASDLKSVLHPSCRANPAHFLTLKRASAAIQSAAEELSHHKVTGTIERVGSVELLATVVWHGASGKCEANFIARLTGPTEELVVTHTAPACR